MNGTLRNVTLRKFWPDLWEVFCMIKSQSLIFPFFPVSTEFSIFLGTDLRILAFRSIDFQSLLRTQVIYIKLGCKENIIQMGCVTTFTYMCKTGCVTTYMYCRPSVMPCILICSVFFYSHHPSPHFHIWFWHNKLKGLIRLRFSHIVEVLGLDFQTRALASSCLSL